MPRRIYDDAFREGAVKLVRTEGYSLDKAAKSLGIDIGTIRRWVREARAVAAEPVVDAPANELRRENARLREENRRLLMGNRSRGFSVAPGGLSG